MSPTRKASSIDGLRRGVATPPATEDQEHVTDLPAPKPAKDARITLNLPPDLYRQLARWTDSAAETIGVPRVGVQDALRAMIGVVTGDEAPSCSARVLAELRAKHG